MSAETASILIITKEKKTHTIKRKTPKIIIIIRNEREKTEIMNNSKDIEYYNLSFMYLNGTNGK